MANQHPITSAREPIAQAGAAGASSGTFVALLAELLRPEWRKVFTALAPSIGVAVSAAFLWMAKRLNQSLIDKEQTRTILLIEATLKEELADETTPNTRRAEITRSLIELRRRRIALHMERLDGLKLK